MSFRFLRATIATLSVFVAGCAGSSGSLSDLDATGPEPVPPVFEERGGIVAVEAEHFVRQEADDIRAWHLIDASTDPETLEALGDSDPSHAEAASGGAYIEILPDTRVTHSDELKPGENFSPQPGKMAIIHYDVYFNTPGRYYVWARAYSVGAEDNGLHVGLDGEWPETGARLQWCEGKQSWFWESKQRTQEVHCGEPYKIYLDIEEPGLHTISFSMREDGFEFDKWLMTTVREFPRPEDAGPDEVLR